MEMEAVKDYPCPINYVSNGETKSLDGNGNYFPKIWNDSVYDYEYVTESEEFIKVSDDNKVLFKRTTVYPEDGVEELKLLNDELKDFAVFDDSKSNLLISSKLVCIVEKDADLFTIPIHDMSISNHKTIPWGISEAEIDGFKTENESKYNYIELETLKAKLKESLENLYTRSIETLKFLFENDKITVQVNDNYTNELNKAKSQYGELNKLRSVILELYEKVYGQVRVYIKVGGDFANYSQQLQMMEIPGTQILPKIKELCSGTPQYEKEEFADVIGYKEQAKLETGIVSSLIYNIQNNNPVVLFSYGFSGSGKTHTLFNINDGIVYKCINEFLSKEWTVSIAAVFELYDSKEYEYPGLGGINKERLESEYAGKLIMLYSSDGFHKFTKDEIKFKGKQEGPHAVIVDENISGINPKISNINEFLSAYNNINYHIKTKERIKNTPNNANSSRSHLFIVFNVNATLFTVVDMAGNEDPTIILDQLITKKSDIGNEVGKLIKTPTAEFNFKKGICTRYFGIDEPSEKGISSTIKIRRETDCKEKLKQLIREGYHINITLMKLQNYLVARKVSTSIDEFIKELYKIQDYTFMKAALNACTEFSDTFDFSSKFIMICNIRLDTQDKTVCKGTSQTLEFAHSISSGAKPPA